ncbi:hypothetical protein F511_40965 [Dorcoceras hygrometricum]|uniref:Uncharacterized protein n=1 Tax=Dorcoceras hygrometricum TaxID=472368 RepID=A0A2Z7ANX1_9LAMI|nr:hypothetical protein F511_40965 [Dorcoceras hygrometricum]
MAGHRARLSRTVARGTCCPPARGVHASGRPRAQLLLAGLRAACGSVPHAVQAAGAAVQSPSSELEAGYDTVFDF